MSRSRSLGSAALLLAAAVVAAVVVYAAVHRDADETPSPPRTVDLDAHRFDGPAAWGLVAQQVRLGPRPAGSLALSSLALRLAALLPHGRLVPVAGHPGLHNVVGTLPGRGKALLIGAHYDTLAAPPGVVGANNGAAGTAVVVEAARALARLHRPAGAPPLRFVLFDGEEPARGLPEDSRDFYDTGLRGSRADAAAHAHDTAAMVLLDYVANKGLRLPREDSSNPALWAQVRHAADRVGAGALFPADTEVPITDDHTPYLRHGVPAVDLIDWSYDGHTAADTLDKLSRPDLDAVGETVVELARTFRPPG